MPRPYQAERDCLARNIECLPIEIRFMIYELSVTEFYHTRVPDLQDFEDLSDLFQPIVPARKYTPPPLLWFSAQISSEALKHLQSDLRFTVHVWWISRPPVMDDCLSRMPLTWMRAGLGEVSRLKVTGIGIKPFELLVRTENASDNSSRNIFVEHSWKWRPYPDPPEVQWLRHFHGEETYTKVHDEFVLLLTEELQQSIRARSGYGMGLAELHHIVKAVWTLAKGFDLAEEGCNARKWKAKRGNIGGHRSSTEEKHQIAESAAKAIVRVHPRA
ncbi:hypothetical protein K461DRAFT_307919 [Myriangium duriaei CBS 260.36]|uniref:Uncharacterized protein n=1 Tax=Myriangium duriaei CBS 260.36 TaxID=1168546 RepID=A0A9P4J2P8_9PEZI|nr:hypothetical protein K461DRAFT_307919 [Myriangium duriaei CBS 260.36]